MSEKGKKETTKTTKQTTKKTVDNTKKAYCYIGPNIPGGALKQNSVLVGTKENISEKFKEEIEKYPQIEKLIVPVERLANAKNRVKTPGNIINKHYQDLILAINAEREV